MRPFLLKVEVGPEQSFAIRNQVNPLFYNQWHYHQELELTYVHTGAGIRFVGDSIQQFGPDDLILLGSNLPHFWRAQNSAAANAAPEVGEATVVQFDARFWGEPFLELPELVTIRDLFMRAQRGIRVTGPTREKVRDLMLELSNSLGLTRILILLQILQEIAQSKEIEYLSSPGFNVVFNVLDTDRIAKIHSFTLTHFQDKIKLEDVANLVHLTPNAFCRYFKKHTRKSFSQFLIEIRVGHACKLLMEGNRNIAQVCLESGFQNFSNFNRYFKAHNKLTPQAYAKLHRHSN